MMLILQLSGAVLLLLYNLNQNTFPVELQLSAFLSYCALVILPQLFKRKLLNLAASGLSILLLIMLQPIEPLSALLLPLSLLVFLNLTGLLHPWLPLLSLGYTLIIPPELKLYYLGINLTALLLFFRESRLLSLQNSLTTQRNHLRSKLEEKEKLLRRKQEEFQNQELLSALEERSRISRDLHDHLGHVISGSVMQIQAAEIQLEKDPDSCRKTLQQTEETLNQGMNKIRRILHSQSPLDEELGLPRIKKLLLDFSVQSQVECSLESEGPLEELSSLHWNLIQTSLKEALTNVHKYSNATHFICRVEVLNGLFRIEFKDNGTPPPHIHFGMGLKNMEERAQSLGGKLLCHTGRGLSLTLLLPKGEAQ